MKKRSIEVSAIENIVSILFTHSRQSHWRYRENCPGISCQYCQEPHRQKIQASIQKQEAITLILPAFPAKSANREKTISAKPDLGERLSLVRLNAICQQISAIYPIGVKLYLCSDGRVFNDLVLVNDEEVNLYQQGIKAIIKQEKLTFLKTFALDEIYPNATYNEMRKQLMMTHGEALEILKQRLKPQTPERYQFDGIHRFIFEDQRALRTDLSKNKLRKLTKLITYEVVRRSNAWSRLLAAEFPSSVRLSIHPQPCGSDKLGIQFLPANNRWATPWHNVLLKKGNNCQFVKRSEAEALGAKFNHDHYVLENAPGFDHSPTFDRFYHRESLR
ncbi:MAG: L-tyrosine/L-tryptophan isonitrile synthase family protein [Legionella sp.]|nr:L-tyrosine/L-tryptophan isonitrile synthase family protein [Legionella sp.]